MPKRKSLIKLFSSLQNLLSDIAKKESDLNNVSKNAKLYQQAIKVNTPCSIIILTPISLALVL